MEPESFVWHRGEQRNRVGISCSGQECTDVPEQNGVRPKCNQFESIDCCFLRLLCRVNLLDMG